MSLFTGLLLLIVIALVAIGLSGIKVIPNSRVGIVEKRFARKGSVKADSLIALSHEAGYQPALLRGGIHYLMPFQYRIHLTWLVTIPQGQIGYVFARDGQPLPPTQTLGRSVPEGKNFQYVEGFLTHGGQRGPQRAILREGTYPINVAQFVVFTEARTYYLSLNQDEAQAFKRMSSLIRDRGGFEPVIIKGSDDLVGIVTVQDGPSLSSGEIIAPMVGDEVSQTDTYHNYFQDPEKFLMAGGRRGRQLQALVEGTYYINRLFATVEMIPKTVIDVGFVGVVVSYAGNQGDDLTGESYKHGELVERGYRGVWSDALMPGKYAFNTFAGKVILVPTTNVILKWNRLEVGTHRLDENLSEIEMITRDAFEPLLPLSVVIHIDYRKAPLVIQRFGDVKKLVEQTLDPMIAAYFKNIGQTRTLIELIQQRSDIQNQAAADMKQRFIHYDLELEEVLIGTPKSSGADRKIEEILAQLRDRQIAVEQIETYNRREQAAVKERELRQAESLAHQQTALTESLIGIKIQANEGRAAYERSLQDAAKIKALAEAEAERDARIGIARALAIEEQVRAYGGPQYQVVQQVMERFSTAVENAGIDVVPRVVLGGGTSVSAFDSLMGLLLSEKLGVEVNQGEKDGHGAMPDEIKRLRDTILQGLLAKPTDATPAIASNANGSNGAHNGSDGYDGQD